MNEKSDKTVDCVAMMRRIRDELSQQLNQLATYEERIAWLRAFKHSDPALENLQEWAAQQAHAADEGHLGRTGT